MAELVQDCIQVHAVPAPTNFSILFPTLTTDPGFPADFVVQLYVHIVRMLACFGDEADASFLGILLKSSFNQGLLFGCEVRVDGVRDDAVGPLVTFESMSLRLQVIVAYELDFLCWAPCVENFRAG